jgi:hypothetical protein
MSKKIIFRINKEGNILIDKVEGYGSSCLEATKSIEKALGKANESTREMTSEYNGPSKVSLDSGAKVRG